jgi:hypothetical protein
MWTGRAGMRTAYIQYLKTRDTEPKIDYRFTYDISEAVALPYSDIHSFVPTEVSVFGHIIRDFKVKERSPGTFVISCSLPDEEGV